MIKYKSNEDNNDKNLNGNFFNLQPQHQPIHNPNHHYFTLSYNKDHLVNTLYNYDSYNEFINQNEEKGKDRNSSSEESV